MARYDASNARDQFSQWWNPDSDATPWDHGAAPYRRLALQLHHDLTPSGSSHSILIATPNRSRLPANASISLAFCLAEELHRTVLLVDACPRVPEVGRLLGCTHMRGFTDLLDDPAQTLEQFPLSTTHPRVGFMPAGTRSTATAAWSPDYLRTVLDTMETRYDFVVLSGGSVLSDTAALTITPHAGCVLLCPIENETLIDDLDAAQRALRLCKARKIAIMMITAPHARY